MLWLGQIFAVDIHPGQPLLLLVLGFACWLNTCKFFSQEMRTLTVAYFVFETSDIMEVVAVHSSHV